MSLSVIAQHWMTKSGSIVYVDLLSEVATECTTVDPSTLVKAYIIIHDIYIKQSSF